MSTDRILQFELARLNAHLPGQRITLKDALSSSNPQVVAKDGSKHKFERMELEYISKIVHADDWDKLRLPILIGVNPKLGRGAAEISGEVEVKVISQVLGKDMSRPRDRDISPGDSRRPRQTSNHYPIFLHGGVDGSSQENIAIRVVLSAHGCDDIRWFGRSCYDYSKSSHDRSSHSRLLVLLGMYGIDIHDVKKAGGDA